MYVIAVNILMLDAIVLNFRICTYVSNNVRLPDQKTVNSIVRSANIERKNFHC